jgi:hypothetical protein
MIPYEELDRALARWKARAQSGGGVVEVSAESGAVAAAESGESAVIVDEVGSVPEPPPAASERTGEIDLAELETYEE